MDSLKVATGLGVLAVALATGGALAGIAGVTPRTPTVATLGLLALLAALLLGLAAASRPRLSTPYW